MKGLFPEGVHSPGVGLPCVGYQGRLLRGGHTKRTHLRAKWSRLGAEEEEEQSRR
jgi:hypothetical protein